jgi:adenine phosphoribosyltransferase
MLKVRKMTSLPLSHDLSTTIRDFPDFPKPGILFKDISPLLRDPKLMGRVISEMAQFAKSMGTTQIVGIESRGFLFGVPLALHLGVPFVPARKKGKLPGRVLSQTYALEYGTDQIELQKDAIEPGSKSLIVDDLIATGGTAAAVGKIIRDAGGSLAGFSFSY